MRSSTLRQNTKNLPGKRSNNEWSFVVPLSQKLKKKSGHLELNWEHLLSKREDFHEYSKRNSVNTSNKMVEKDKRIAKI